MKKNNWIFIFPVILLLTAISSMVSLLSPDFYFRDSGHMALKCYYMDLIHLFLVAPIGLVAFVFALRKSYSAKLFIIGIMSHLAFMFGFNAMSLVLNELFLIYISLFSLNIFGIIWGYADVRRSGELKDNTTSTKLSAVFLMLFALTAYYAWLAEVFSATAARTVPESVAGMNLPVSVVHVFDMGFALPVMIIGAVLLFRGLMKGLIISAVMSVFMLLISLSLLAMELALLYNRMPADDGTLYSMYVLAPLSLFPVVTLFRSASKLTGKNI